ncbi:tetratricopeptide repeat protein [uncultured Porphyromonas sp.]|uniref:tetratricopeptide repeat protein n=1 Tax=uncultured Porphyromonas sp. TaxID=159274 RepID=UPI0026128ED7|nr:tetratricopeptide repeat protein [uncultured Porphyromonas sp.]
MMKRILLILSLLTTFSLTGLAQKEVRHLERSGNKLYQKEKYDKAELKYRKALEINPSDKVANFNLANTLLRTERGDEADKIFQELLKEVKILPKEQAADVAHNAGNLAMSKKDYAKAVDMYKESLRRRPTDEETRYNLALAQKLLQQQQQENNEDNKDDQQNQDQQQQDNQQQQNQQDQQQNQQKDQPNKQQEQPQNAETMSQDNAEKILQAYIQDEKDTQRKVEQMKQQQQRGKKSRPKNW